MKEFRLSIIVTVLGLAVAFWWGSWHGLAIATLLSIMEISLSFDNAVVNATVLRTMSEKWQRRFLTWGILIAVFGMRLLFPLVIVAFATGLGVWDVGRLALESPDEYSAHVLASHVQIAAFGGMFLLMVFLQFIMDETKELHWIGLIERRLASFGKLESVEVIMAMSLLLVLVTFLPEADQLPALYAGTVGVVLYVASHSLTALMSERESRRHVDGVMVSSGLMAFMYLQFLDSAFSLDGVVGAFAISRDVVIIMLGLGIGAMFVRSLTVFLVRRGTLEQYVFLEHGAHWGIGALAAIMLANTMTHVSEIITGLAGAGLVGLSLWSSILYNRRKQKDSA